MMPYLAREVADVAGHCEAFTSNPGEGFFVSGALKTRSFPG
jgi:hypothetical protein